MIMIKLFFIFVLIGAMTYGGGYSVLPLVDDLIVNKQGWLTTEDVADIVSISEMSPGPFSLNCASFVGMKVAGFPGSILATLGFLMPSLIIILALACFYRKYRTIDAVKQVFTVLNACIIGVLFTSAISLLRTSLFLGSFIEGGVDVLAVSIFAGAFIAIFWLKLNPLVILLVSAVIGALQL